MAEQRWLTSGPVTDQRLTGDAPFHEPVNKTCDVILKQHNELFPDNSNVCLALSLSCAFTLKADVSYTRDTDVRGITICTAPLSVVSEE